MNNTREDLEKKAEEPGNKQERNKKRNVEELPYCTTAPSAEHLRANDEDEPCDDGRAGNVE